MKISESEVQKMKLKGKPKCLTCGNPLSFVYDGAKGYTSMKCLRCKQEFLVNLETLEVKRITKVY